MVRVTKNEITTGMEPWQIPLVNLRTWQKFFQCFSFSQHLKDIHLVRVAMFISSLEIFFSFSFVNLNTMLQHKLQS